MVRSKLFLCVAALVAALASTTVSAVDYTWIGGGSGSADWEDPGHWDPYGVPDSTSDNPDVCDVLTGARDITTGSTATDVGVCTWVALGGYEDRLTLSEDLAIEGDHQKGWYNTSRDSSKMALDLNGNTFTTHGSWWMMPDITIEGPGTFIWDNAAGLDFAVVYSSDPSDYTTPVFESTVTIKGVGPIKTHGATIPNLTSIGNLDLFHGGITINGDLNVDHQVTFLSGQHIVEGDVLVKAGTPSAGLYTASGVGTGMYLKGDIIDTNTEQNGLYNASKLFFVGGGNEQILDIRRQSYMRIVIDPCSHVVLGSDYYAPYAGTITHGSAMGQAGILDVANHDLTLTDLAARFDGDYDEAPIFKYVAGADSGSITILGDTTNAPSDTGLRLTRFKVEITDGGGWTGGDDFILFYYDQQGSGVTIDPEMVSISLPSGWTYNALVHDTTGKRVYLDNLETPALDSDGDGVPDSLDLCPDSDANFPVDDNGCLDSDGDGVGDTEDLCSGTPPGTWVEPNGCAVPDSDVDGVFDPCDDCPGTPVGAPVDGRGCPDTDADGVADDQDNCPGTPPGVTVDENGCPVVPAGMPTIPRGTAAVDGYLDEWAGAEWTYLNALYYGEPDARDMPEAKFTARWDEASSTIYVAAVVTDNDDYRTDGYGPVGAGWDDGDRIEILSCGDAEVATGWDQDHDIAQEYAVGVTLTTAEPWAAWGTGEALDFFSEDPCLTFASRMVGNQYIYEAQVVQYDNFAGDTARFGPTVVTDLSVGHIVRFDVIANTRHSAGFGMKAVDSNGGRFTNSGLIVERMLVEGPACGDWGYLPADLNHDCDVTFEDFALLAANWQLHSAAITGVVAEGAQLTELYSDAGIFFEGPCWDPAGGKLYFCYCGTPQKVLRLDGGGLATVWKDNTDYINGTFIANDGRMITAEVTAHKVMSYQIGGSGPEDPQELVYDPTLKQPNDLCQTARGDIYFSDPDWGTPANSGVYRRDLAGVVTKVISDMGAPNGLIGSNDGAKLYVADSTAKHIRSYPVNPADGTVGAGSLFFDASSGSGSDPDGLTIDALGNVYMAGLGGVWVISPAGVQIEMISVPETASNVTFGGPDNKTLFITCQDKVYSLLMQVAGGR